MTEQVFQRLAAELMHALLDMRNFFAIGNFLFHGGAIRQCRFIGGMQAGKLPLAVAHGGLALFGCCGGGEFLRAGLPVLGNTQGQAQHAAHCPGIAVVAARHTVAEVIGIQI